MPDRIQLRPFQEKAIRTLQAAGVHLALTAPTGAGKGVILERLAHDGERILLLTPLIALGRQQESRFKARGVPAFVTIGNRNGTNLRREMQSGVWISSPESLLQPPSIERLTSWRPTLIAVDEAHCIHEWGDRFRPAYRALVDFVRDRGYLRTLWMSATFPKMTLQLLQREIPGHWITQGGFALPESLSIEEIRVPFHERLERVRKFVLAQKNPGILFAGTRKNVGRYLSLFEREGSRFLPYHAGMSDEERRGVESLLQPSSCSDLNARPSVIATNAFGMGMDYPHLSWVVLAGAPFSLLAMMQAFGRVARGGARGHAQVYWSEEDFRIAGYLAASSGDGEKGARELAILRSYLEASRTEKVRILEEVFL